MTLQLPGRVARPAQGPSVGALVFALVGLVALAGGAFVVRQQSGGDAVAGVTSTTATVAAAASNSSDSTEVPGDFALHFDHLERKLVKASEKLRKAQDLVRLAAPVVDRNFMELTKRRLESSDANMELARREVEEALEEVALLKSHVEGKGLVGQ